MLYSRETPHALQEKEKVSCKSFVNSLNFYALAVVVSSYFIRFSPGELPTLKLFQCHKDGILFLALVHEWIYFINEMHFVAGEENFFFFHFALGKTVFLGCI